jgi:hypothetical protein
MREADARESYGRQPVELCSLPSQVRRLRQKKLPIQGPTHPTGSITSESMDWLDIDIAK